MREMKLELHSLAPNLATDILYDYFLLVTEQENGAFLMEHYGVAAASKATGERVQILNITASVSRINDLMERLARNQVSPIHLRDVIDDWL